MYCKNCGKLLGEGDKFCSGCGSKVTDEFIPAFRKEETADLPKAAMPQAEERPKRKFHIEDFNWDLDGYPTAQKKTEAVDFNWSSVLEEKKQDRYVNVRTPEEESNSETEDSGSETALEEEIFSDMGALSQENQVDNDEPTRILARENRTEFYTYNKKNEALQAMLDREYEKLQNGEEVEEDISSDIMKDGRSPEEVMADLLETKEQPEEAAAQEAGVEPDRPPCKEEKVALELVAVTWASTPKGVIAEMPAREKEEITNLVKLDGEETAAVEEVSVSDAKAEDVKEPEKRDNCPPRDDREEDPEEHKLTFDDVFGDDDDSDESHKKGKALKIIAVILCILVAAELVMIGIQYFAPDSAAAKKINQAYGAVMELFSDKKDKEPESEPQSMTKNGKLAALIEEQKEKGTNIAAVEEDQDLIFQDGEDYGFGDFGNAYTFDDRPWYTDEGKTVTYGQELVGTLIQYYSLWIDKINGKNKQVLKLIDETTPFYEEVEQLKADKDLQYGINRLAIGEIRVGNVGFYVRTSVTIVDSKKTERQEEHIVYLEPDEKVMKIVIVKKV